MKSPTPVTTLSPTPTEMHLLDEVRRLSPDGDVGDLFMGEAPEGLRALTPPEHHAEYEALEAAFRWFAGDGAGGQFGLWLTRDPHPVVWFSSEGGREVVGATLEEFLASLAVEWEERPMPGEVTAADARYREWFARSGLAPCDDPRSALVRGAALTAELVAWVQRSLCAARTKRTGEGPMVLVPKMSVGVVVLGEEREAMEARLRAPKALSWKSEPRVTTVSDEAEGYLVEVSDGSGKVRAVTCYLGPRQVTLLGRELLAMHEAEALAVLRGLDPDAAAEEGPGGGRTARVVSRRLGLALTIEHAHGSAQGWVQSVRANAKGTRLKKG